MCTYFHNVSTCSILEKMDISTPMLEDSRLVPKAGARNWRLNRSADMA